MKFLVLALCVCAASAATFPWQTASRAAAVVRPAVEVAPSHSLLASLASRSTVVHGVDAEAPILRSDSDVSPEGFHYSYETGNGIAAQASGALRTVDKTEALTHEGSYSYTSPDGTPVQISYVADENGYQPQGSNLPVAPPIPVAIQRALEYIAQHPPAAEPVRRV